jgi:rubredoxin
MDKDDWICPHCGKPLVRWEPCAQTGWVHDLFLCDNNECSYFVEGRRKIACRYCYNPANGQELPIVSWCGGDLSLLKGRCGK